MDSSNLYWLPFRAVYQALLAADKSSSSSLDELLNLSFQWLLEGAGRFGRPNEKSAAALRGGGALKAPAWGAKRGIAVDKHLCNATCELSQLLGLDELQCHLLIKRWLKDNDVSLPPPPQAGAAAPLALPAPGGAAATAVGAPQPSAGQAVLAADVVRGVADSYAEERIYLAKCQQFVVMTAIDVAADASPSCRAVLKRLLDADWEPQVFRCLTATLRPGANGAVPVAASQAGAHVVKPPDLEQRLHLHQLHERCELLCLHSQLFCGADPSCSTAGAALASLAETCGGGGAGEPDGVALAAAAAEAGALRWPECSEERLLQLLQLLGDAVFSSGASSSLATRNGGAEGQAAGAQQLAEALACSLILSALRPAQLLQRLADSAAAAAAGGPLPRGVSPFRQWRSIEAAVMHWRPVPGCALALLSICAYSQLLSSYRGAADAISPGIQQVAMQAGGFAALAVPLGREELSGETLAGAQHRGLLLQALSLMAAAFDLSPLRLPGQVLEQLVDVLVSSVEGCPHLAAGVWDEAAAPTKPLRHVLDEACSLFPAFPHPFLRLATGLAEGPAAAAACYTYLCSGPCLAVHYPPGAPGLVLMGAEAELHADAPWAGAPEVQGTYLPQGSRGRVVPLPEFARRGATAGAGSEGGGGGAEPPADDGGVLVAWDVTSDQGTGPVLLLARAAHCLQQLHAANSARQPVADSEHWQDLRASLQLVAALLRADPLLAKPLLAVSIVYTSSQQMDWLDVVVASLNVLPSLATTAAGSGGGGGGGGGGALALALADGGAGGGGARGRFCLSVLSTLGDCLAAAAAAAGSQPGRVMAALGTCQLFAGVALVREPLQLVPLEGLGAWVQGQQQQEQEQGRSSGIEDWSNLSTLQALLDGLEVPSRCYPLTSGVVRLLQSLLGQHCTWGVVPGLVCFTLHRVLGAMPWLPFSCASARWQLAASALGVVRAALLSGAVAAPGAAGPKAPGAPGGILVTALAARMVHHMATAGHGYLSAVLPPPADSLRAMAEQQAGSSTLLAAATELAEQLLLLVPPLLGAVSHLSPEMPLQQYWGSEPPGGGLSPVAVIGSFATLPTATRLQLLALEALNAFAILQDAPGALAGAAATPGFGSAPLPSGGGPLVPRAAGVPAGATPYGGGPLQHGLSPLQPYLGGLPGAKATGMGAAGRGAAAGWWRPRGLFSALLAALPQLRASLLLFFEPQVAQVHPAWAVQAMALLEAGVRYHPELLDSLCFPSGLRPPGQQGDGKAAGGGSGKAEAPPAQRKRSALDGVWALLRQAPSLLQSQPALLAAVLRLLSVLWECQASAHGAVDLLRSQPDFWTALKACCPTAASLPRASEGQDAAGAEAAAWRLQVHACALHVLLLELLSLQVGGQGSDEGAQGPGKAGGGPDALLAALGPRQLCELLGACAELGLQPQLLDQLTRFLQVTYLQLGASAVAGAWGPSPLSSDALSCAAQFRAEVAPLLDAAAAGQYALEDLRVACDALADPERVPAAAAEAAAEAARRREERAAGAAPDGDEDMDGGAGEEEAAAAGARGGVLADALCSRPFGEVLLGYCAVTPWSWAAGETEYGRQFLFDSNRLCSLLGPFLLDSCEGAVALAITLDDVSAAASVAHARLALLQAAASLLASLSRSGAARRELLSQEVGQELLRGSMQVVDKAMSEAGRLTSSPAARLLSLPWGLPFLGHASSIALLLAARSMLLAVRVWKVAGTAAVAGAAAGRAGACARPALMARSLNHQQLPAASASKPGAEGGSRQGGPDAAALSACAQCASLLSRWLRGRGGDSLAAAAAAAAAAAGAAGVPWDEAAGPLAGAVAADVEVVECLCTGLLLMLQVLPGCRGGGRGGDSGSGSPGGKAPRGSPAARGGGGGAAPPPAELLEVEAALLDLLPVLCKCCATAVDQQALLQGPAAAVASSRQAYAAAALQLLIELLQHQLPPALWLGPVSQHLALVPMLSAAAARAGRAGFGQPELDRAAIAAAAAAPAASAAAAAAAAEGAPGVAAGAAVLAVAAADRGSAAAAAAAAAGVAVTDISVLELALAVAQVPEGALQLWQQGLLPALLAYCRRLMHAERSTGLLDLASLGFVGPAAGAAAAAVGAASGLDLPAHMGVSLGTLGAYMSVAPAAAGGCGSVQTVAGLAPAAGGAGGGGCVWSPRHQQWCLLLSLLSTLLQQLSRSTAVDDMALHLLVATEPRLLLAVQLQACSPGGGAAAPPLLAPSAGAGGGGALPTHAGAGMLSLAWGPGGGGGPAPQQQHRLVQLTLANLLEAERALFLLGFVAPHIGTWQLQRPGSLAAFRTAAARLVEFVAAPSLDRSLRVACAPLSPFERRLAKLPSGLEASEGWFKLCAQGGANHLPKQPPAEAAAGALVVATAQPPQQQQPASSADGLDGGGLLAASGVGGCSEYCARLCEALYTACEHSLALLLATAPVVEPEEVAGGSERALGPMWPAARALTALQDQALAVGTSMVQQPQALTMRRRQVAAACVRITAAAAQLLQAVAPPRWGAAGAGGRRGGADSAAEAARRHERMVQVQRAVGAGL